MRNRRVLATGSLLAAVSLHTSCGAMLFFGPKEKTHQTKGLGTIRLPAALEPHGPRERTDSVLQMFGEVIGSFFWMGSGTPYRAVFAIGHNADPELEARAHCASVKWLAEGSGYRTGECVYEINANKAPSWLVVSTKTAGGVRMAYRVFKKSSSLEKAVAVFTAARDSFQPDPGRDAYFASLVKKERDAAEGERLAEESALRWFAAKGWPEPVLQTTQIVRDMAYVRWHRQTPTLEFLCLMGTRKPQSKFTVLEMSQFQGQWRIDNIENTFQYTPYDAFESRPWQPGERYYFLYLSLALAADEPKAEPLIEEFLTACGGHL